MRNNLRLLLRFVLTASLCLVWQPSSFGTETRSGEGVAASNYTATNNLVGRASASCGIFIENKYLPKTLKGRTMCGAAVSEMVSCMSKKLHLGAKCEANCGAGKDFVSASCTAKMAKCGYKRAHPGSPDCARPGAVTAFLRSPTPRGRFWGHVQFGCGDRFCSSYKTPIEKSWPHGKTPDVCYILESKEIQNTESQIAEVKPTELPRFDFGGHPLPTNHSCRNCSKLAELIQRYEKADTDEKMEIALEVAEVIRKTAADVDQRSPEAQRLEVKAAMIASLAVSDGDFDAATTYRLMGVCAKNPDSFNDVFEDFEPIEQAGIAEKMKTYQKYNKMGLGCKIPEAGEN